MSPAGPALVRTVGGNMAIFVRQLGRTFALHRLDIPAMIAWGAADPVTPLPIGEHLARETPGAGLTVWPGLGHRPQLEDPALVAEAVAEFLCLPGPLNSRSAEASRGGFPLRRWESDPGR